MDDKKSFVENELKNALMKADSNIIDVRYNEGGIFGTEYVFIGYKDITMKLINITGNSGIAIMHDVAKRLLTD